MTNTNNNIIILFIFFCITLTVTYFFNKKSIPVNNQKNILPDNTIKSNNFNTIKSNSFNTGYVNNTPQRNANVCSSFLTRDVMYPNNPPYVDYGKSGSCECDNLIFNSVP